jgi:hypothetical protein
MKLSVFNRGTGKLDQPDDIYVERIQMDQGSSIIKSSDYFVRDVHQLIVDGEDFGTRLHFIYSLGTRLHFIYSLGTRLHIIYSLGTRLYFIYEQEYGI